MVAGTTKSTVSRKADPAKPKEWSPSGKTLELFQGSTGGKPGESCLDVEPVLGEKGQEGKGAGKRLPAIAVGKKSRPRPPTRVRVKKEVS